MLNYLKTYVEILSEYKIEFLIGLGTTLLIAAISLFFAVLIGIGVGYINFVPTKKKNFNFYLIKTLQWIGKEYIDLIRGTPLLVQAIFFYFGVVPIINKAFLNGQQMSPEIAGVIIISLNAGAFLAEIFRGGIQAIDTGQMEAARSLGLSFGKAMRKVILPQAIKNMIPAILNQFITSLKDTSLLMVIGVADLMGKGQIAFKTNYKTFETMLIIALIYYLVIKILSTLFKKIEGKLKV
ncbi:amino acid ABC transporter permease [Leptotrichia buccalis]|jgi:amino ABC transporter, permease protein, 3-TM region, his/glu/gln/arg/opine family|uniref:Polar amino acid ABC transporter, inner membrane subunit n=1 Tax=Leptotrichia buccalis (strain ATCC 14201 / DSM 1135 / JCM 12969 / NCTC 10249 / C-1013-b) TaxID=523794 RepID=C7NC23_LEPBD|nr:amino acid ABC transporter permease [Leptotrichia buccalis]ACV39704.1 polar amino acid ABC transporter, inner membrane subunit [Leptotrichia buccalis C-1013-b]